jgi:hypothetical protein
MSRLEERIHLERIAGPEELSDSERREVGSNHRLLLDIYINRALREAAPVQGAPPYLEHSLWHVYGKVPSRDTRFTLRLGGVLDFAREKLLRPALLLGSCAVLLALAWAWLHSLPEAYEVEYHLAFPERGNDKQLAEELTELQYSVAQAGSGAPQSRADHAAGHAMILRIEYHPASDECVVRIALEGGDEKLLSRLEASVDKLGNPRLEREQVRRLTVLEKLGGTVDLSDEALKHSASFGLFEINEFCRMALALRSGSKGGSAPPRDGDELIEEEEGVVSLEGTYPGSVSLHESDS